MKKKFDQVYQFKITLQDIKPPVWRRIQVTVIIFLLTASSAARTLNRFLPDGDGMKRRTKHHRYPKNAPWTK
jgi:hypothetical protein